MLQRSAERLAAFAQRRVPDPFVIALALTALAFAVALVAGGEATPLSLAAAWRARVVDPATLAFTVQMALVLVAGATLAAAPAVRRRLSALADRPRSTASAVVTTALVAMCAALVNWGFGLIAGALLAREIGARARAAGRALNYPLVVTAAYSAMLVWHGGFSGSAPLKAAEGLPGGGASVPLTATLLSPLNLAVTLGLLVAVPLLLVGMISPAREQLVAALPQEREDEAPPAREGGGVVLLTAGFVLLGAVALAAHFGERGLASGLDLNAVNLLLILTGLLLLGGPSAYARAFTANAALAGGILLQFPIYFGVLGLLEGGGVVAQLSAGTAAAATGLSALGLPLGFCFDTVGFFSAALVNLFVPSGGGQWAVQGPILVSACRELGLPVERAILALAYGDEWSNLAQPFWALPLLGLTGLRARDILGYGLALMAGVGLVYLLAFALF